MTDKPRVHKIDHLTAELSANNYVIVLISETWLRENKPDKSISIPEYTQYRRKRLTNRYGELVTYIHTTLASKRIVEFEPADSENKSCAMKLYAPPPPLNYYFTPIIDNRLDDFLPDTKDIIYAVNQLYDDIIFIGYINCKHSDFYENDQTCPASRQFEVFFKSHSFEELIHEPTLVG